MVPLPRLCTACRSPRRISVQVSGRTLIGGDTQRWHYVGILGDPTVILAWETGDTDLSTTLRRVSLPS